MNRESKSTNSHDIASQLAHETVKTVTDANEAKMVYVKKVQAALNLPYEQALSFVNQELSRKAASERYRKSQAYRDRLELQKQIRQLMK